MGIKEIFKEGMNEFKRRSALSKENNNLKRKQEVYSEQLTGLGKKAWESKLNMGSFGDLEGLIAGGQKQQDELKSQVAELEKQKQETEDKRKEKNESFNSRLKEEGDKKKEVDARLGEEQKTLKQAQKESQHARDRLERIAKEEEQLHKRATAAETPEAERTGIREKLDGFPVEKGELAKKIEETAGIINSTTERIKPIAEESAGLQGRIDQIRAEQREVVGQLDKSLAQIKTQINDSSKKLAGITKEQDSNFEQLGVKLSSAGAADEAIGRELADVKTTGQEMSGIKAAIEKLEQQGTSASRGALWKMAGLIAGALAVVILIIVILVLLFGSGDKAEDGITIPGLTQSREKVLDTLAKGGEAQTKESPASMKEAMADMQTATAEIKKRSQQIQGKEIVAADKAALMEALPVVGGWQMKEPSYNKGSFGQLETAHLRTTYTPAAAADPRVDVEITDTATASALLQATKMFLNMNIASEDEESYQKISTYNDVRLIEKYDKQSKRMEFVFIVKERYLVVLRSAGDNSQALLKEFMAKFNLSKLQ